MPGTTDTLCYKDAIYELRYELDDRPESIGVALRGLTEMVQR